MSSDSSNISNPQLTWNEQGLPISEAYDDVYFSKESGLEETRYVFLQHNQLPTRWIEAGDQKDSNKQHFTIFETGFGTGLNFLATLQAWIEYQNTLDANKTENTHYQTLNFISVEKFPLDKAQLQQALDLWPELSELSAALIQQYPPLAKGFHQLQFKHGVSLTLIFDDVANALPQLNQADHNGIDAWFLDGFTPAKNPDMWSDTLFRQMACLSHEHTTVATFTAAGLVKRGLKGAGFAVKKVKGYGRKREMLCGEFKQTQGPVLPNYIINKPWLARSYIKASTRTKNSAKNIAIIGAGIAGCSTAYALARRGIPCTLIDKDGIANAASGNPQGAVYSKLAADNATHSDVYIQGLIHSLNLYNMSLADGTVNDSVWQASGLLQLAYDEKEQVRQNKFAEFTDLPNDVVTQLDQQQASEKAGVPLPSGGLFFPNAGWLNPAEFCNAIVQHPLINFVQAEVTSIEQVENDNLNSWQLTTNQKIEQNEIEDYKKEYHQLVIANAFASKQLFPDLHLPLKSIRGQLSYFENTSNITLNTVLCGRGYISPAKNGLFCSGATYHINDDETNMRSEDHDKNKQHLPDFGEEFLSLAEQDNEQLLGRVGFRCTTPDYLPMAGPVLNQDQFITDFSCLIKNAKKMPKQLAEKENGLYLNIGHGSRGLSSAPLCGELIAAYLNNEVLPVSQTSAEALLPSRFFIRDMIRNKLPKSVIQK